MNGIFARLPSRAELERRLGPAEYARQLDRVLPCLESGATISEVLCDLGFTESEIEIMLCGLRDMPKGVSH